MRRPSGSYRRFTARGGALRRNLLRLERLEERLTLSQNAPSLPYDMPAVGHGEPHFNFPVAHEAQVADFGAFRPQATPVDARNSGMIAGSPVHLDFMRGAGPAPFSEGDYRGDKQPFQAAPMRPIETSFELVVTINLGFGNLGFGNLGFGNLGFGNLGFGNLGFGNIAHTPDVFPEANASHEAIALSSTPPIDSHLAHSHDAGQTAGATSEPQTHFSPPVIPVGADLSTHVSQVATDVAKRSSIAPNAVPVSSQQPVVPLNVPADNGFNKSQAGVALIPQAVIDFISPPSARLPQSEPNVGRSVGSAAGPGDEIERTGSEDSAVDRLPDRSANNEHSATASVSSRAALLANLQLDMKGVDQALEAMVNEIERFGGELVTWLDDSSWSTWGTAAAAVAAFGLGSRCIWRLRGRRLPQEDCEEESASWLFSRLQGPVGQR